VDGTLCDTDPIHHEVFKHLLLAHGKNGGVPIDEAFFLKHIAGRTNEAGPDKSFHVHFN
jgi:beta-phosphoglucomutase-like phosphatase (HAD superfamily)